MSPITTHSIHSKSVEIIFNSELLESQIILIRRQLNAVKNRFMLILKIRRKMKNDYSILRKLLVDNIIFYLNVVSFSQTNIRHTYCFLPDIIYAFFHTSLTWVLTYLWNFQFVIILYYYKFNHYYIISYGLYTWNQSLLQNSRIIVFKWNTQKINSWCNPLFHLAWEFYCKGKIQIIIGGKTLFTSKKLDLLM